MRQLFDLLDHGGTMLPVVGGTLILVLVAVVWCCLEIRERHQDWEKRERAVEQWRRERDEKIARQRGKW